MNWIVLIAGIINLIFAYLVFYKGPSTYFKYYFSVFIFLATAWIFSNFALIMLPSYFWLRITYTLGAMVVVAAFVWVIGFNDEQKPLPLLFLIASYGIGLVFAGLCYINNIFMNNIAIEASVVRVVYGRFFPIYSIFTIGVMLFLLVRTFQYAITFKGGKRTQARYIFLGLLGYILTTTFGTLILPLFGWSQFSFLDSPSSLFFIGFTTYAITKHHLMDISVIISRAVAEILAIVFHGAIYLLLVWLYINLFSTEISPLFIVITTIYGIIVGQTHQSLRLFFQTTAEKVFVKGKYNYYKAIADASAKVGEKLSLSHILKILYSTFDNTIEIHNSRVFLPEFFTDPEKESLHYVVFDKTNCLPTKDGEQVDANSDFVVGLIDKRKLTPYSPFKDTELIIPCLLENRLIGFFALGKKLSEDRYTDEDLHLLEVLASQAAVTLDHTRSYEKIALDLQAAEHQMERSQRLASIGTLTAGVTHEIRNPLTVIRAETERLANQARDQQYLIEFKDLLLKHITRIESVVQKMLGMAKETTKQETDVNLNEQIDSVLSFFRLQGITLSKDLGQINALKADPQDIQELLVNLIQNAIDAMPNGGSITIKTYMQNNRISVDITDTGKGIPAEIREKIFDPFYSTRHEGIGLGLSIVYRIVRQYGGDIKVISEVGKGSTFKLLF